jgi:hypothetical protein
MSTSLEAKLPDNLVAEIVDGELRHWGQTRV